MKLKRFNDSEENAVPKPISKLIYKKLNGEELTDKEFLQLHNWMIENDSDYAKSVDLQMKKDLKKLIPKGAKIK